MEKEYTHLMDRIVEDGFSSIVVVMRGNTTLGTLYGKEALEIEVYDVGVIDPLFNQKYGNIQSLYVDYP